MARQAVIDVGTSSVKLHVGERRADGTWSTVADRATVTRLGEGLDAAGAIQPEPMRRTADAIVAMADEARRDGAAAIAAVGTAGLRAAANGAELVAAVDARCGVRIEIIPGDEEGRLAYLAAKLDAMPEGEGTVLDNSCLMFLSNLWAGRVHNSSRLPVVLAGSLGGTLETGRSLDYLDAGDET